MGKRTSQGPHSQILMTGGGWSDKSSYFIPKKITTSEFVYPKKSLHFLAYPKKSLSFFFAIQKNPSVVFFATQKNPGVFHRPKKITFGQNFRPKKITWTPPSLKYVSGALGRTLAFYYGIIIKLHLITILFLFTLKFSC